MNMEWSPTGDRFAYDTLNDVQSAPDGNGLRVHVARYDPGSTPVGQSDTMIEFDPMADDEGWPVWSPDGSRVAFDSYDEGMARVVLMPVSEDGQLDASEAIVTEALLTIRPGSLAYAWAPDGSQLVVVDLQRRDDPAYLMDARTGELTPLGWGTPDWPSWQPITAS